MQFFFPLQLSLMKLSCTIHLCHFLIPNKSPKPKRKRKKIKIIENQEPSKIPGKPSSRKSAMEELVKRKKKKNLLKLRFFLFFLMVHHSEQSLPPAQYMAVQKIKQQMSLPEELSNWNDSSDFCNLNPIPILTIVCYEDNITQLHLNGNITFFPKFPRDISTSTFFSNLDALPNLKVLTLVSLGLRGPLPSTIGLLSSLEIMNLSSNSFSGALPMEMASLKSLQTLVLDNNMFTGQFPDWLASLPSLTVLSLKNNSFSGFLPKSLSGLNPLRTLVLSANNLYGNLPNFRNLTNLQVLDLEGNAFGPNFPTLPIKLESLVLKNNRFGLGIPDEVKSCYMLKKIDVSFNGFVGPFPPFLLSMPSMEYLDISGNKLTGKLSKNMSCGSSQLSYVALSSNRLTGELPDCLGHERTTVLCSGNCLSNVEQWQHQYAFCRNEALAVRIVPAKHEEKKGYAAIVGGVVGGVGLLGLAIFFVKMRFSEKKVNKKPRVRQIMETVSAANTLKLLNDARYISETRKLGRVGIPPYRAFTLDELREATDNFDASNVIGEGSCGQVYKGMLTDGTTVAIRALKVRKKKHCIQHYTHQLELLSKIRHCHLVSAIGHCFECDHDDSSITRIFLVFEFVPNGTLREVISDGNIGQKKFSWPQRMTAALGIARGIQFLHTGIVGGIFSNQLKITDILLDHNTNVKISKYNLPLLAENKCEDSLGASSSGRRENAAAERLEPEDGDDVYCFGVILLELIMGRKITTPNEIDICKDLLYVSLAADELARRNIVDPSVSKECSDHSLKTMIELCIRCVSKDMSSRPSVEDLIWNVQYAAQVQESWGPDSHSTQSSPRGSRVARAQNVCDSLE